MAGGAGSAAPQKITGLWVSHDILRESSRIGQKLRAKLQIFGTILLLKAVKLSDRTYYPRISASFNK
jgi:hypothetical protein